MSIEPVSMSFSDHTPYPPVKVCGPNPQYARLMLKNIASYSSEMSAISLYIYNSVILKSEYPDLADCFLQVSKVEMRHLEIYCQLASLLGADPRLWSYSGRKLSYWSPSCNQYPRLMPQIIEYAICGEYEAIESYRRQSAWVRDEYIVNNINRIILDEERHIEIFHSMLEELRGVK